MSKRWVYQSTCSKGTPTQAETKWHPDNARIHWTGQYSFEVWDTTEHAWFGYANVLSALREQTR